MSQEQDNRVHWFWFVGLTALVVGATAFSAYQIYIRFDDWPARGQFGDMFGAINSTFTGLAFAGLIYTVLLQNRQLRLQSEDLKCTREELSRSATAQEEAEQAFREQIELAALSSYLSATQTLLNGEESPVEKKKFAEELEVIRGQIRDRLNKHEEAVWAGAIPTFPKTTTTTTTTTTATTTRPPEPEKVLTEQAGQERRAFFGKEDIVAAFRRIPDFKEDDTRKVLDQAYLYLRQNGVVTVQQLNELVDSKELLETLRKLYRTELLREQPLNLDPLAVAAWGAILYSNGLDPKVISFLVNRFRRSPEYREKHLK